MWVARVSWASFALLIAGCSLRLHGYECSAAASCGDGHECVQGSCAVMDGQCGSGYRWDSSAGSRNGECASLPDFAVADATMSMPDGLVDFSPGDSVMDGSDLDGRVDLGLGVVCGVNAFCDSFESGLGNWTTNIKNGTGEADNTRAQQGKMSFHITTESYAMAPGANLAAISLNDNWFAGKTNRWVRFYLYVKSPLPTQFTQIQSFQQTGTPFNELQFFIAQPGTFAINNGLSGNVDYKDTGVPMPADAWACIEYHLVIANPGLVQIAVNGVDVATTLTDDTTEQPPPDLFALAWGGNTDASDPGTHEAWYDNVVLSTTRVGCSF